MIRRINLFLFGDDKQCGVFENFGLSMVRAWRLHKKISRIIYVMNSIGNKNDWKSPDLIPGFNDDILVHNHNRSGSDRTFTYIPFDGNKIAVAPKDKTGKLQFVFYRRHEIKVDDIISEYDTSLYNVRKWGSEVMVIVADIDRNNGIELSIMPKDIFPKIDAREIKLIIKNFEKRFIDPVYKTTLKTEQSTTNHRSAVTELISELRADQD